MDNIKDYKKIDDMNQKLHVIKYLYKNRPYNNLKDKYRSIIPLHLYTCWHTKDLPPLMKENYDNLVASNPEITFHLYDENEARYFIKNNFEEDVLNAYDTLIPTAYKFDLWRYCILYINGGIYMDIKYKCVNGFKLIDLTEKECFVRDAISENVYNALILTLPKNQLLFKSIRQIVNNVENKYYGNHFLDPTGPGLLGKNFTQREIDSLELYHYSASVLNKFYIAKSDTIILDFYEKYREEQSIYGKNNYYISLYREKNIYKENI
jgi:mannosyltransferase OCH1-like enzyme